MRILKQAEQWSWRFADIDQPDTSSSGMSQGTIAMCQPSEIRGGFDCEKYRDDGPVVSYWSPVDESGGWP